jgi:hypothetical protein
MKTIFKFATLAAMAFAFSTPSFAQQNENRLRGIVGPVRSSTGWSGASIVSEVPGAALFPILGSTTSFYLGFTAGVQADINNMVLYTTRRGSLKITAVTPVTLGGVPNPSIDLASASVCPVVEISANNPCIVRLDLTPIRLVAPNDYYLAVYFTTSDTNNNTLGVTQPAYQQSTSLRGSYTSGDESRLAVGASIPSSVTSNTAPYLLMYVMTE